MGRIFFVSRAFPPVLGGIENHNHQLSQWLAREVPVVLLANRHGKKALPLFALYALVVLLLRVRRDDVVLLGDGVLAPCGWLVRRLRGVRVIGIVHGLDLTWTNRVYQTLWVGRFLPGLSGLIAVSQATREEAIARHIPAGLVQVVPNGVDVTGLVAPPAAADGRSAVGMSGTGTFAIAPATPAAAPANSAATGLPPSFQGKTLLLTLGRMVRRKGVAWFVEQVMPALPTTMVYVVAGDGPEYETVERLVAAQGLQDRVLLLGRVDEARKRALLAAADLFVQPNIVVSGDVEGFGIAVIEATACGTPVVASDLQGLRDAVLEGETGTRLPPGDAHAWIDYLAAWMPGRPPRAQVATATRQAFAWSAITARYLAAIRAVG